MAERIGFYPVNLRVEREGMPGSPVLHLQLGVSAPTGQVTGHGEITQAVAPPGGHYPVINLSGVILHTGFGEDHLLVPLKGEYLYMLPPPMIGTIQHPLFVSLSVDRTWNGRGAFTFGGHWITDCTATTFEPGPR